MRLQQQANAPQPMAGGQAELGPQIELQAQMQEMRAGYERQLYEQSQMIHAMVSEKEGLGSKMKKLYQRTAEGMKDEESKQRTYQMHPRTREESRDSEYRQWE